MAFHRLDSRAARLVLGMLLTLLTGCLGPGRRPLPGDPTVLLRTSAGDELGVATDYGVLFLGRGAGSGRIDMTAWFADGASWEAGSITPVGGGLFSADTEIRLATVPISFDIPGNGADVVVRGRRGPDVWETDAKVRTHPNVEGLLLRLNDRLERMTDDEIGAGVYVGEGHDRRLIGLVSGRLLLETPEGTREFVTVMGPQDLWRAVLKGKAGHERPEFLYREDIR